MKSTGVVRRVDELGRIVIPKEIRRTLRIKDGESLEIFVDREMITLKKFSRLNNMEEMAKQLADIISHTVNKSVFITDCDICIAAVGGLRKKYIGGVISDFLDKIMKERKVCRCDRLVELEILENDKERGAYVASPIIVNGDVTGLVLIVSDQLEITDLDESLVVVASQILGKNVEE